MRMRTDEQLLEELKGFAYRFTNQYNLYTYEDGGYTNALGDFEIDDDDWINSESLREEFDQWVVDNDLNLPNTKLEISFDPPELIQFSVVKRIR